MSSRYFTDRLKSCKGHIVIVPILRFPNFDGSSQKRDWHKKKSITILLKKYEAVDYVPDTSNFLKLYFHISLISLQPSLLKFPDAPCYTAVNKREKSRKPYMTYRIKKYIVTILLYCHC